MSLFWSSGNVGVTICYVFLVFKNSTVNWKHALAVLNGSNFTLTTERKPFFFTFVHNS